MVSAEGWGRARASLRGAVRASPWLAAQLAFAALLLLVASPILLGLVEPNWDARDYFYPSFTFFQDALGEGRLPYWDPFTACGVPFLADPQNGYPLSPLAVLLAEMVPTASTAFGLYWVLTWLWGGLGAARLSRLLGASPSGGFLSAVTWALSGYYVGHAEHTPYLVVLSWTPWVLSLAHEAVEREDWLRGVLAGTCLGLSAAAGYPGLVIFEGLLLSLWLGGAFLLPAGWRVQDARPLRRRAAWVVGVLAGAALLLAAIWSPTIYAFLRDGRGYTDRVEALAREDATASQSFPWPATWSLLFPHVTVAAKASMGADPSMTNAYLGVWALPLAALWWWRSRGRHGGWFVLFVGVGFLLALGAKAGLRGLLYDLLPATRFSRHAAGLRGFWMLAVAAAAGAGFTTLIEGVRAPRAGLMVWGATVGGAALGLLAWLGATGVEAPVVLLFLPAAAAVAAWALALGPAAGWLGRWRPFLLLAVVVADLGWQLVDHRDELWMKAPHAVAIAETMRRPVPMAGPREPRPLLYSMNVQQIVRIPVTRGYVTLGNSLFDPGLVNTGYHEVLEGLRFWLGPSAGPPPPAAGVLAAVSGVGLGHPLPLFVEGLPQGGAPVVPGSLGVARVTAYEPEAVGVMVSAPPGEPLVLASTERWSAGWRVAVDGRPAQALRVNRLFRGVAVGPGNHVVEWRFDPGAYPALLALSWLVMGGVFTAVAARAWRRRRGPAAQVG